MQLVNLRLAAVYGCGSSGKLKFLSALPSVLQKGMIKILGGVKPMVSFEKVVQALFSSISEGGSSKRYSVVRDSFDDSIYYLSLIHI